MAENRPVQRRRWFQFRLRTLLIAVLIISLPLSWFAVRMERARRQREAVEAIEQLGGAAQYGYRYGTPPQPVWLRNLVGDDFFDSIAAVTLIGPQVTDAGLEHLNGLTQLQVLSLYGTEVTDGGLEHLKGLTQLQLLLLDGTEVTPSGVQDLQKALPQCVIRCYSATDQSGQP